MPAEDYYTILLGPTIQYRARSRDLVVLGSPGSRYSRDGLCRRGEERSAPAPAPAGNREQSLLVHLVPVLAVGRTIVKSPVL